MRAIAMAQKVLDKAAGIGYYTVKARLTNPAVEIINADGFAIFDYCKNDCGNETLYFEFGKYGYHYMFGKQGRKKNYWTSDIETGRMSDVEISDFEKAFDEFLEIL